jgi:hypothetical protein
VVSPLLLCPAAGGVLELSGVFGGRLSFSRSATFSSSNASKRASNCKISASFSLVLSKLKFGGEIIHLQTQIRRRATPFRASESNSPHRLAAVPHCISQPSARQGREQLQIKPSGGPGRVAWGPRRFGEDPTRLSC